MKTRGASPATGRRRSATHSAARVLPLVGAAGILVPITLDVDPIHDIDLFEPVLAAIRPHSWNAALFLHVLGGGALGRRRRVGLVDARDIAEFAARLLTRPDEHAGKTYTITGPASISMATVASALTDVLGTSVAAQTIPAEAAIAAMIGGGLSEWLAEVVAREYGAAYAAGWGNCTTPDFEAVVGRPPPHDRRLRPRPHGLPHQLPGRIATRPQAATRTGGPIGRRR
jgi:hypothetical protein